MSEKLILTNQLTQQIPDSETYLQIPDYLEKYPNIREYFCAKIEKLNSKISVYAAASSLRLGDLIVRSGALSLIPEASHNMRLITNGLNFIWGLNSPFEIVNSKMANQTTGGVTIKSKEEKEYHKKFLRLELEKCDYFCLASIAGCEGFLTSLEETITERKLQGLPIPKILTNFLAGSHPTKLEDELGLDNDKIGMYSRRFVAQITNRVIGTKEILRQNQDVIIPKYMEDLEFRKFRAKSYFQVQPKDRIIAIGDVANGGDYGYSKTPKMETFVLIAKELIKHGFKIAFVDPTTNFSFQEIAKNFDQKEQNNLIFSYSDFQPIFWDGKEYMKSTFLNNVDILSICTDYLGTDTGCSHFASSIIQQAGNNPNILQLWSNAKNNKNRGIYDKNTGSYKKEEWQIYNSTGLIGFSDDYYSIDTINPTQIIKHFIPNFSTN